MRTTLTHRLKKTRIQFLESFDVHHPPIPTAAIFAFIIMLVLCLDSLAVGLKPALVLDHFLERVVVVVVVLGLLGGWERRGANVVWSEH